MTRRSQQGPKAVRQAQKKVEESLGSDQGQYQRPSREHCTFKQWEMPVDDGYSVRVQTHIWRHEGRLVDFCINLQVFGADGWITVEHIDCCHGYCHHHPLNGSKSRSIHRLDDVADVQRAFKQVETIIEQRIRIIQTGIER